MNVNEIELNCYGCSACYSVCPTNSINMGSNDEGFLFPYVDALTCVNCGKCLKVCPANDEHKVNTDNKVYAGIHNDSRIWSSSTSGGAFSAICELYGDEKTYIAGAVFEKDSKSVRHKIVKGISEINCFLGSKYVQSDIGDTFGTIRNLVIKGEKVIFSGTPCQVAGLKRTLENIDCSNLLTIDLFCNGVGSPGVFKDYLDSLEEDYDSKIISFKFRDKKIKFGIHNLYRATAQFENGKKYSDINDLYNNCFVQKAICRKSCFHCPYNMKTAEGDISIGDFKKQYIVAPKSPYNKNGSIIISHTPKGDIVCRSLEEIMTVFAVSNDSYEYPIGSLSKEKRRDAFFDEYIRNPKKVKQLLKAYSFKQRFKMRIWSCIPDKIRGSIKRALKR